MRSHDRPAPRQAGYALLEIIIAVALLAVFGASALMATSSMTGVFKSGSETAYSEDLAMRALDSISQRLRSADATALTPQTVASPFTTSSIEFQRAIGFNAGAIVWGDPERIAFQYETGEDDDGVDNDGDGLVDEGIVVWITDVGGPNEKTTVLCSNVSEGLAGENVGNGIDDNGNGLIDESGLSFTYGASDVTVYLSLENGEGLPGARSRTVALRNTPEAP